MFLLYNVLLLTLLKISTLEGKIVIPYSDCYDIYMTGLPLPGIYNIGNRNRSVRCLENGWTTIQHRGQYGNPQNYFAKPWAEYVKGFGIPGT